MKRGRGATDGPFVYGSIDQAEQIDKAYAYDTGAMAAVFPVLLKASREASNVGYRLEFSWCLAAAMCTR